MSEERWVWVPFEVDKRYDGYRVDRYLAQRLVAYSRARVQKILGESRVMRFDQPMKPSARVHGGDKILIAYPRRPEAPLPADASLPILFEDEHLILINKPSDLLSHPTDKIHQHTVMGILRHSRPDLGKLHLLHRLDRETSGVLALAKTREAARAWTEAMTQRLIRKQYMALVQGVPSPRRGTIDWPIGKQSGEINVRQWVNVPGAVDARTRYQVIAVVSSSHAVVRAFPETGRLHQIRVHFAALGHPLLGDVLYQGDGALYLKMTRRQLTAPERETLGFQRLALHAEQLTFPHPIHGKKLQVQAPLPGDMAAFIQGHGMTKIDTLSSALYEKG